MTPDDSIARARAVLDAATEPPWKANWREIDAVGADGSYMHVASTVVSEEANAIVLSRNVLPALLNLLAHAQAVHMADRKDLPAALSVLDVSIGIAEYALREALEGIGA